MAKPEMEFKKRSLVDLTVGALAGVSSIVMAVAAWSLEPHPLGPLGASWGISFCLRDPSTPALHFESTLRANTVPMASRSPRAKC